MSGNKRKKWFTGLITGALLLGLLSGCGASDGAWDSASGDNNAYFAANSKGESFTADVSGMWSEGDYYDEVASAPAQASSGKTEQVSEAANAKRKLIKTVNMTVETQEYDILMNHLQERINELGGYIQKLESNNGSSYSGSRARRNANLTIRIPQAQLDAFVSSVSELANIVRRTENVEDITLSYVDLKSHKESLQIEQKRLLELLEKAEYLEDILTLEERLTRVRYQIESMESQLRTYDDQVDYSTVYLSISEVLVYTPIREETAWERMSRGFLDSVEEVRDGAVDFAVWVVSNSPHLVICGVILVGSILFLRKRTKKLKQRAAKKQEKEKTQDAQNKEAQNSEVKNSEVKNSEVKNSEAEAQVTAHFENVEK